MTRRTDLETSRQDLEVELHPPQQGRRTDLETSEYDSEVAPDTTTARQFRTMAENRELETSFHAEES